nr:MAG TPA: hypothetical protein [Caudoviricetes sp.]
MVLRTFLKKDSIFFLLLPFFVQLHSLKLL